jgi:hypothetical protein
MRPLLLLILLVCQATAGAAQPFRLLRFDESYEGLMDSVRSPYNRVKYIPLSVDRGVYASFGGEARLEYAHFENEDWGRLRIGSNDFLLQRYDVHADLHAGPRVRVFAQLRSAWESGRKAGPRPIDEDRLNVQNLFADVVIMQSANRSLMLRAGRQELDYGSGRLISVREGPNLRLYFTGLKARYVRDLLSIDGFIMMADTVHTGGFDNKPTRQANLWGAYATYIFPHAGNLDVYYLGVHRNGAVYEAGTANEVRHTLGGRLWKYGGGFIYNFEAAYQLGTFGNERISAWTASSDLGYMFESLPGKPSINIRTDYISGDDRPDDGRLQTFNPLYPKGGYFGFSPQVGPVNLADIHPYAYINVLQKLTLQGDVVLNWRASLNDGVYRPSGGFNLAGSRSDKRYIGTAFLLSGSFIASRFITITAGGQYFRTGAFIRDLIAAHKDGIFINTRIAFKF